MSRKSIFFTFWLCTAFCFVYGQDYSTMALYPGKDSEAEIRVYLPEKSNGMAVIACPGGGYSGLQLENEGYSFAPFFNNQGIALIVLKYRMPAGNYHVVMEDAEKAIKLVRQNALNWNINSNKIGVMGASAGGHLASALATHFTPETRPDFQILLYPVITMDSSYTNPGTRLALLGKLPAKELIRKFSNELNVTKNTPPAFIVHCSDDEVVVPRNSVVYYLALQQNHVPAELHIYPDGGHGWGISDRIKYKAHWTEALTAWLKMIENTN